MNYGLLKITENQIICRCGFKYIKFQPSIQYFPERGIGYKEKIYKPYDNGKLFLRFSDEDIINEAMTTITISNCQFLSQILETTDNKNNIKRVVLDQNHSLYPIIQRRPSGSDPTDLIAYDPEDYIIIEYKTTPEGSSINIYCSENNISNKPDTDNLETDIDTFLKTPELTNLVGRKIINSGDANKRSFRRFRKNYEQQFILKKNQKLNIYNTMDVIDLAAIDQINATTEKFKYPVLEISKTGISFKGDGINPEVIDRLENGKYYYMLVHDCFQHCITRDQNCISLNINTSDKFPKQMLFIKFNKQSAKKYMEEVIIDRLIRY